MSYTGITLKNMRKKKICQTPKH